jgi:iron complex outermembrane receptor protein
MRSWALWLSASALTLGWCGSAGAQTAQPTTAPNGAAPPAAATTATTAQGSAPAASRGSNTVQEVVVTGERRNTALQKTSIAATVLTGADLVKAGVFTVDQLQFVSPSLTVNNFGQGDDVDIRGIGKGEHNTQTSTGVITYRDSAPTFPGYIQEEPYYDVASVEVLRGPQGTFSGQNATGGAIIVNTNNPVIGGGYDGYLNAHYGNYNDGGVQGAVNLPISSDLAARVAVNLEHHDTWDHLTGPWSGDPNTNWASLRVSLLWKPVSQLSVLWKTDYDYLSNGGYFGSPLTTTNAAGQTVAAPCCSNLYNIANNWHTSAIDQFIRSTLKIDYVSDSGVTFRSVTSGQTSRSAWTGDIDGTAWTGPTPSQPTGNNWMIDEGVNTTQIFQEFNIISPNTGRFSWILGANYGNITYNFPYGDFDIGVPHGPANDPAALDEDLNGTNLTHNWAVFGQASYNLPAGFQLQVGARYSSWFTGNRGSVYVPQYLALGIDYPMHADESGSNVTGKVTLNWNLDRNNFLYAFVATGAKPGGLNTPLYFYFIQPGLIPTPFRQEYVTDYEIGWKSTLLHNHLHLQLGAYDNIFQHFQVIIPLGDVPTQSAEQNVPGRTKLYGVEASAQAVFGDLSFYAGLGLEHSQLGTFYTEDSRVGTGGVCSPTSGSPVANPFCLNLTGHPQTYAPDFTFNAGAYYDFHLADGDKLTPGVTFSHISDQWATLYDNPNQGDYLAARDILGASLAWTRGSYVVTLYGYNLTDDHYVSAVASPLRIPGAPLQVGLSLTKTF